MSRKTHLALVTFAAIAVTSCQLKITSKTTHGGPGLPAEDPPTFPSDPSGDPAPGQPGLRGVSGDGQVTVTRFAFADPLSVALFDSYGHPVTGATVTWKSSDTQGALNLSQTTSQTDSYGVATLAATAGSIGPTESSRLVTVTATAVAEGKTYTRVFYETVALSAPRAFFLLSEPVYSVQASSVLQGALKVAVVAASGDQQGQPLPGVSLKVTPIYPNGVDPNSLPAVGCVGGTVLTNIQGEATCDLAAHAQTGTVQISVSVGRFVTYDRSSAQVTR